MDVETLTPDAEETSMRELGIETDAAQGREDVEAAPRAEATAPEPEPTLDIEQSELSKEEQPQLSKEEDARLSKDEQLGRDIKTGQFKKAERPETEYSKAQKEEIRKTRTWQNIQAEKEQHRQEVAQWQEQRRMEQLEAARQQYQPLKKEGLTAQQYYEGARRFEQEGDYENALKAYKVTSELSRADQQRYAEFQQVDKEYQWRKQLQQVGQIEPKVFDPNTPIGANVQRIINANPGLYDLPEGFLRAAEFAHMFTQHVTQAERIKELEDENIALKAENEKFQRKGQPGKGGYASPRLIDKEFDSMSLDEQEAALKRMTAEADNWR